MDRFIPSIGIPKCLTALKDKYLPPGLQKMLRQSTRFSLSFHMPSQESKFGKRESQLRESIDCKYNSKRSEREVSKRITEESVAKSKEMSVQSNDIFKRIESSDRDDNWNIADDNSTNEVSIADRWDNLNKLNINSMVSKWDFSK